jgi:hypothetical protein
MWIREAQKCSSVGCSLAQWKVYFLILGESRSCDGGGAQRSAWRVNKPKKCGGAQRSGAHARPEPTSINMFMDYNIVMLCSVNIKMLKKSVFVFFCCYKCLKSSVADPGCLYPRSGFCYIRIHLKCWMRIRIRNTVPKILSYFFCKFPLIFGI